MKYIFVASMSRSGGTLLYQMIKLLIELRKIGTGCGFPSGDAEVPSGHRFAAYKSEPCQTWMRKLVARGEAYVLGTYRDPRDVAASLVRFYSSREVVRFEKKLDPEYVWKTVIETHLPNAISWYSQWEWSPIYQTRYEIVHPKEWHIFLVGCGRHLGIDVTMEEAKVIRRQFSIAKTLKRQAAMTEWISPHTLLTKEHVTENRGRVGTYHEYLTKQQIWQVEAICSKWMTDHGYATETQ